VIERLRRHLGYLGLTIRSPRSTTRSLGPPATRANRPAEHALAAEVGHKSASRFDRRIRVSGLVERKTLEAFDWDFQTSIDRSLVLEPARLDFVGRHDDLVITGKSGTGKSHILKALSLRTCVQGISLRYVRCASTCSPTSPTTLTPDGPSGSYRGAPPPRRS
jgi:hypothetical protein